MIVKKRTKAETKPKTTKTRKGGVVAYLRVSSEQQRDGVSLRQQEQSIRDWAKQRGLPVISVHRDVESGAKASNRPGLTTAVADACKAKGILTVYAFSRASRSMKDLVLLAEEIQRCGAHIASVTEPVDTSSPHGEAFFHFIGIMAQLERRLIGQRTRDALQAKKRIGERVGRYAEFGHRIEGERVVVDETEQRVIKLVVSLRAKGMTYREIGEALAAKGIRNREGKVTWAPSTLRTIVLRGGGE